MLIIRININLRYTNELLMNKIFTYSGLALLGFSSVNLQAAEQDKTPSSGNLDAVSIIGGKSEVIQVAGSANVIDAEQLEKFEYTDIQRVLSAVPGVSFRNEDGYGLRPNISLRGTRDDRSGKITLMEDGVLIAPAPYSASSAYYFPTMGRINSVEVIKGASAIENGPYTIGGAVNLLSTPIPYTQSGKVNLEYGSDNTARAHAWVGDSKQNYGWLVEAQKHQSDGFATIQDTATQKTDDDTGFDKEDILAKFRVNTDRGADVYQQVDVKLQYSTEISDQTYVGLTEADFAKDAHERYGLTQQDEMDNEHKEFTLSHLVDFGKTQITTTGYYIDFKRDWFKVDKIDGLGIDGVIDCANGNASECGGTSITSQAGAIAVLSGQQAASVSLKHNNRIYQSKGIQSKINHAFQQGTTQHALELGLRYHEDSEERLQPKENWQQTATGAFTYASAGTQDTRYTSAKAWSVYLTNDITTGNLVLTPGVRVENYKIEREGSPDKVADEQVTLLGLGATYQLQNYLATFAGLHQGHSPAPNDSTSDPEEALNFETGVRFNNELLQAEAIVFVSDYSNLLGACTASGSAGDCEIGDVSNGGKALVQGLELLANTSTVLANGLLVPMGITYTYTDGKFKTSFDDGDVWGEVNKGDKLPSLSDHQLQLRSGLSKEKWGLDVNLNYFSDTCSTAACGNNEEIDAYTVIDIAARYQLNRATKLYANVDNLLNSEDVVARAPKNGARAQKPLSFLMGVSHSF